MNFKTQQKKIKKQKKTLVHTENASSVNVSKFMIQKIKFSSIIAISATSAFLEWIITVLLQVTVLVNIALNTFSCS